MSRTPVHTTEAPPPRVGIYSQAIVAGNLVFCSGQLPADPATGSIVGGDVAARTHQCITNLGAVLSAAGSSIENVAKVNVFLTRMEDFDAMNEVYEQYWGDLKPARSCVVVKTLPRESDVEIECVGVIGTEKRD